MVLIMEMERINENTIRVMIENDDLKERGMTVMDLLGNHENIEKFFYSILDEVDTNHDFEDEQQVTFQILPNKNGLELFISKVDEDTDVEELFGKVIENHSKSTEDTVDEVPDNIKDALIGKDAGHTENAQQEQAKSDIVIKDVTLVLNNFESAISLAHEYQLENTISSLVSYNHKYYLNLAFPSVEMSLEKKRDIISMALEFGRVSPISFDVLREHGKIIFERTAIQRLNEIF